MTPSDRDAPDRDNADRDNADRFMLRVDEKAGDLDELAEHLRRLLAAVEAGEIPAEVDQIAYLRGALAAVEVLRDR